MEVDNVDEADMERQLMSTAILLELLEFILRCGDVNAFLHSSIIEYALKYVKSEFTSVKAMAVLQIAVGE